MKDAGAADGRPQRVDAPDDEVVLVADLDGSLCRTDTLHEALLGMAAAKPTALAQVPGWLARGRARFKEHVADIHLVPGSALPLNDAVIGELRAARAAGRRTALITAADQRQADTVAEAAGLFDEVFGSSDGRNLKGEEKARFLTERYGAGGFDYIGDHRADLPIWKVARRALTVGADSGLRRAAERVNPEISHLSPPVPKTSAMLRAIRPHQWAKNLLLFLPALAAHDASALGISFLGFLAFCLTASAIYVINDLLDLAADRAHPRKRLRPFAAGELNAVEGAVMAAALLLGALVLSLMTGSAAFVGVLAVYLATTFAYSLRLKRLLIVDVLTLTALYTLRIIAGGAVTDIHLSPWMLGFSVFIFLALAAVKRQAELTDQLQTGRPSAGRAYEVDDLPILRGMAISAVNSAVLVLALYLNSDYVREIYSWPSLLWLLCPLVLYWLIRMVMMTHRGHMTDDPIVFAATDRASLLIIAASGLVVVMAAFL